MEENEVYKDIIGFPNYQISNYGNVKSLNYNRTFKEQILVPQKVNGYLRVGLMNCGKRYFMFIHRLVANAFIPNDDIFKTEINHKDENKENNHVSNIEWTDKTFNINYGTRNERCAKAQPNRKPVNQYSLDGDLIKTWESAREIEKKLGFAQSVISRCCNGKIKTAYGFIWKFV